MENLTYRELQKLAKEFGIPANIKKENMRLLIEAAQKEKEEAKEAGKGADDKVQEEEKSENGNSSDIVEETECIERIDGATLEDTVETNTQADDEKEGCLNNEEADVDESTNIKEMHDDHSVNESVNNESKVRDDIVEQTASDESGKLSSDNVDTECTDCHEAVFSKNEDMSDELVTGQEKDEQSRLDNGHDQEVSAVELNLSLTPNIKKICKSKSKSERKKTKKSTTKKKLQCQLTENLNQLSLSDLRNVAKSLGISNEITRQQMTKAIVDCQKANQCDVVVEMDYNSPFEDTCKGNFEEDLDLEELLQKDAVEGDTIDDIFYGYDDSSVDGYETEELYYDGVEKKLFNTPAKNSKIIFSSPTPTKSGSKPYEKYSVKWRYEDYENQNPQQNLSPEGMWTSDCEQRIGQKKLLGISTPQGKKTVFTSPAKSTEKPYYRYNVHWSYDQYHE